MRRGGKEEKGGKRIALELNSMPLHL